jgi:hypothetical protein
MSHRHLVGPVGDCASNARRAAAACPERAHREGLAFHPAYARWLGHAWTEDETGTMVEVTAGWLVPGVRYLVAQWVPG